MDTGNENPQVQEEKTDWLPEQSKEVVRRLPDYQRNTQECEACQ